MGFSPAPAPLPALSALASPSLARLDNANGIHPSRQTGERAAAYRPCLGLKSQTAPQSQKTGVNPDRQSSYVIFIPWESFGGSQVQELKSTHMPQLL